MDGDSSISEDQLLVSGSLPTLIAERDSIDGIPSPRDGKNKVDTSRFGLTRDRNSSAEVQ